MKKLALILVTTSLVGLSYATTVWNPVANGIVSPDTGDFLDPLNWTNGIETDLEEKAVFNVPEAATCILSGEIELKNVVCGDNAPGGTLILADGAVLTTHEWTAAGFNESGTIIVETGATANFLSHLWLAHKNDEGKTYESSFIVNGGTVTVSGAMTAGFNRAGEPVEGNGRGVIELNAGTLHNEGNFFFDELDLYGSFDIEEGVWTLSNDREERVNLSVENGTITAYDGEGTVVVAYDDVENVTRVTATAPTDPGDNSLEIIDFTFDIETGNMSLTWNSEPGGEYRIDYSADMNDWGATLEESYPADEGETTTFPFNKVILPDADQLFFRVEKVLP